MSLKPALFVSFALITTVCAADELTREYEQVRKIALRDPKVQAAFANANKRLDAKIVEIDPALAGYVAKNKSGAAAVRTTVPAKKTAAKSAPAKQAPRRTHTVAKGDTLASIARHYGVSIADLRQVNRLADENKLAVGQKLNVPAGAGVTPANKPGFW